MSVTEVVEGIIDIIKENVIAKTNVISDVLTGEVLVKVENSFHFSAGDEVVLIDYGYNDESSPHYQKYEYCVVKEINNTYCLTLEQAIEDPDGGWLVSNHSFIQKTIGHAPLYDDRVYYGDREVIPTEEMAITVEPNSLSNEWIYIHGGLSNEYRVSIMVYGKDIETEEGMKILNMYTDVLYDIFNKNIHIDINNYDSPMLSNVAAGSFTVGLGTLVVVEDTTTNRTNFIPSYLSPDDMIFEIQDNIGTEIDLFVTQVTTPGDGKMYIYVSKTDPTLTGSVTPLQRAYNINEYAVFKKHGRYFYDSRIDNIEYGMVQKGSAFLRAARLNWFGKEVEEIKFPQRSYKIPYFPVVSGSLISSSSSSSSSIDSSSSSSSSVSSESGSSSSSSSI